MISVIVNTMIWILIVLLVLGALVTLLHSVFTACYIYDAIKRPEPEWNYAYAYSWLLVFTIVMCTFFTAALIKILSKYYG